MKAEFATILLLSFVLSFEVTASEKEIQMKVESARAAAGEDYARLFQTLCGALLKSPTDKAKQVTPVARENPKDKSTWHADPVKVFDNLYFLGQKGYSAWALQTSSGIILIDALFDYSVEDEIVNGLKKLGLDPSTIKYAIILHGHFDHYGGAKYLQDNFGTRIVVSAADWELIEKDKAEYPKPKRDLVATDKHTITLGDTTVALYITPGHTPGTTSLIFPVKDKGKTHIVAEWGGTAFNFEPTVKNFEIYAESAKRFSEIAKAANADVVISNHSIFDGSVTKLPAMATRKPHDPNPFVVGTKGVSNFLTVARDCALAHVLALQAKPTPQKH